jgi:hypothetical protein
MIIAHQNSLAYLFELEGTQLPIDPLKGHTDPISLDLLVICEQVCLHKAKVDLVDVLARLTLWENLQRHPHMSAMLAKEQSPIHG